MKETSAKTHKVEVSSSFSQSKLPFGSTRSRASKSSSAATSKADILISIKPVHMSSSFCNSTQLRLFFFFLVGYLCLVRPRRCIATISPGKSPGEIEQEDGMGNADFNAGLKEAIAAYEIKELYQLKEPLALTEMQGRYGA